LRADTQVEAVGAVVELHAGIGDGGDGVIADGVVQTQSTPQFGARAVEESGPLSIITESADEGEAVDLGIARGGTTFGACGATRTVGVEDVSFGEELESREIQRARAGVLLGGGGEVQRGEEQDGDGAPARLRDGGLA